MSNGSPFIHKTTDLYKDGVGLICRVSKVKLPGLKIKEEEDSSGLDIPIGHDTGMERLKIEITTPGFEEEISKDAGVIGNDNNQFTIRSVYEDDFGNVKSVVANATGSIKEYAPGEQETNKKSEEKYVIYPTYYKLTVNSNVIHEIDIRNYKRIINGVDQLAKRRAALGRG